MVNVRGDSVGLGVLSLFWVVLDVSTYLRYNDIFGAK